MSDTPTKEVAIRVDSVYKDFSLPHLRKNSIKSIFTGVFRSSGKVRAETQHALRDISFEIYRGEFFGIVGRNGSGKSTLLKVLAGIYQPNKGSVGVAGKLVPFIELGVGFNPELSGRENVYLNGALLGFDTKEIDEMYDDIVDFAELEKFMDQKLKNYSSGMQVRLAFSMAIRADADILLIDEVLAVGDADFQRKCFEYFKALKKNKKTVVFVSHDMSAVESYCDRAILIDDSRIVSKDPVSKIAEQYLKLFNVDTEQDEVDRAGTSERWGNGKAKIENVTVALDKAGFVRVESSVIANEEIENPVFGFQIKNSEGMTLCGTNNKVLKQPYGLAKPGKRINLTWQVPDVFSEGKYTVDVAVSEPNEITQLDWWSDAAAFRIKNKFSTPHVISPTVEMTVE